MLVLNTLSDFKPPISTSERSDSTPTLPPPLSIGQLTRQSQLWEGLKRLGLSQFLWQLLAVYKFCYWLFTYLILSEKICTAKLLKDTYKLHSNYSVCCLTFWLKFSELQMIIFPNQEAAANYQRCFQQIFNKENVNN